MSELNQEELKEMYREAVSVGRSLLKKMAEEGVHEFVAQAALGSSWIHVCFSIGFDPETFQRMCMGLVEHYKSTWEKRNQNDVK